MRAKTYAILCAALLITVARDARAANQAPHDFAHGVTCASCHMSHVTDAKPKIVKAADTCKNCHDATYTVDKYMPGTGSTMSGLFVRTHTFNKNQARPSKTTASGEPVYNKK